MERILFFFFLTNIFAACSQNPECATTGDKKNGEYVEYYSGCKKKLECYFKNGVYDSTYTEWEENGAIKIKGQYKHGKKIGAWRHNGILLDGTRARNFIYSEYTYDNGVLKNAYEYISSSNSVTPKNSEKFVTYGKDTLEKRLVFHDNGRLAGESFSRNGLVDSTNKAWDENGRLFAESYTKKSRRVTEFYYHPAYTNKIFYKDGFKQIFRQFDLSGKLLYEAYYNGKEKLVRSSGKRIGDDND